MEIRKVFTKEELKKFPELSDPDVIEVLSYILKRVLSGKNALGLTLGAVGTGKSFTDLRIAELLMCMQGKVFNVKTNVFFGLRDFLAFTNKPGLEAGSICIPEELGVSMGSRQWQRNVDYSQLLQTFRDLGLICLFNVPFKSLVDKHARLLSHFQIEMLSRKGNKNVCKFFLLQHNASASSESKATYRKYIRVLQTNKWGFKKKRPIKKLFFNKPSPEILAIYLPMQSNFKSKLRKMLEAKTIKAEEVEGKEPSELKEEKKKKVIELFVKGVDGDDIAKLEHISRRTVDRITKPIRDKTKTDENGQIP